MAYINWCLTHPIGLMTAADFHGLHFINLKDRT